MLLKFESQGEEALLADMEGFSDRRIRATLATALTRTAGEGKRAVDSLLPRVFDRPTPYTLNSTFMRPATAQRLFAEVYVKDDMAGSGTPATKYLLPQVDGGSRGAKRFELALQAAGAMPNGWHAVPATGPNSGARFDAYGNVSRGQIIQILAQVGVELTAGYNRRTPGPIDNRKGAQAKRRRALGRAGGQYIAVPQRKGKLAPGIYIATGRDFGSKLGFGRTGKLLPVFLFVPSVHYQRRLDFDGTVGGVVALLLPQHVERAIDEQRARLRSAAASGSTSTGASA